MEIKFLKRSELYIGNKVSRYFPSVRWPVLLIIIPAVFIVIIYFFTNLTEIVTGRVNRPILDYEERLAPVKNDLPANALVNYISTSKRNDDLINARYSLIPVRIIKGLMPIQDFLIFLDLDGTEMPEFEGYTLKKNYGNGVMLFERDR